MISILCMFFFLAPANENTLVPTEAELRREKVAIEFLHEHWHVSFNWGRLDPGVLINGEEPDRDVPCVDVSVFAIDEEDAWINQDFVDSLGKFRFLESMKWDSDVRFNQGVKISFGSWLLLSSLYLDVATDDDDKDVEFQPWVLDMFCEEIGKSQSLREVWIVVQTPEQLAAVLRAENLESLTLWRCGPWPAEGAANAEALRELYLQDEFYGKHAILSSESLKSLAQLPALEELSIELKDDSQLELLLPLKDTLKYLDITGEGITSDAAKTIRQFTKLRSLSVSGTSVDDRFVSEIKEMPLDCLVLVHTKVTDDCVPHLTAWESLKEVAVTPLGGAHGETAMTEKSRKPLDERFGEGRWDGMRFLVWQWDLPAPPQEDEAGKDEIE